MIDAEYSAYRPTPPDHIGILIAGYGMIVGGVISLAIVWSEAKIILKL